MKIGRQSNFFVWSLTTKLSEMETKSNADKMKGRLLFTSPLVLATKALRPPFLSERWLFHKEGLRLRIICWWCNYTAGCTQRCKKYLDGCNYTLRTGWNVQKEECFHVAQIFCRGVKILILLYHVLSRCTLIHWEEAVETAVRVAIRYFTQRRQQTRFL